MLARYKELPEELWFEIIKYLDWRSILQWANTSHYYKTIGSRELEKLFPYMLLLMAQLKSNKAPFFYYPTYEVHTNTHTLFKRADCRLYVHPSVALLDIPNACNIKGFYKVPLPLEKDSIKLIMRYGWMHKKKVESNVEVVSKYELA